MLQMCRGTLELWKQTSFLRTELSLKKSMREYAAQLERGLPFDQKLG